MSASRLIVALALVTAACGASAAGPPTIAIDATACSYCGMLVSEPEYAAAYRPAGGEPWIFDDIGCMVKALRHEKAPIVEIWVQDAAGGGWIDAGEAVFVSSPNIRTPMHGGILAYPTARAAADAAAGHGGDVIASFTDLMNRTGDAR
jgi:copper chaperone NosL